MKIYFHENGIAIAQDVMQALATAWDLRKFDAYATVDLSSNEVQILIRKTPQFLSNGMMNFLASN